MSPQIQLGPFELIKPVGKGGMGVIWSAVHRVQRVSVAVKVLTLDRAQNESFREAFRKEVRSVAGLQHPNIVYVFDHGEVPPEAEASSAGRMLAGTPYLAMELVPGGSLSQRRGNLPWPELRDALLDLLAALAHAHARGVIHRDIKPGNVLVHRDGTVKLTDFGLAHALDPDGAGDEDAARGGTPAYMAPEQLQSRWRDYGPWTDLYGLGCLAWSLATGAPPFRGATWLSVMHGHLTQDPGPLHPQRPVAVGFEAWLHTLLHKSPRHRFRRAADAAWALLHLSDELTPAAPRPDVPLTTPPEPSRVGPRTTLFWSMPNVPPTTAPAAHRTAMEGAPPPKPVLPPLPASWRRLEQPHRMPLIGAGLGLYGLRAVALVGRKTEQDALWAEVRELMLTPEPRVVLLQGPVGCGKSRLAEWLCERAHEVGAAEILKASWDPVWGHADGLGGMVSTLLGCTGLPPDELAQRLEALLREEGVTDPYEWRALTELIMPGSDHGLARPASPAQRYVVVQRFLERLCNERPVIMWLDDVHFSADAIRFAEYLMHTGRDLPVLLMMTALDSALPELPLDPSALRRLMSHPRAVTHTLGNLTPLHAAALVRELLGLEGELADQVEARSAGNPMFAVQLVGDWVNRGMLEATDRGFRLRPGTRVELPDDLHALWSNTVRELLREQSLTAIITLELGAILGQEVDAVEWRSAARIARCPDPLPLAQLLVDTRLMAATESGWTFVHSMIRESLERTAREAGRWEEHNRACAQMLRDRYPASARGPAGRLGRHLLEGGHLDEGLELLLAGARHHGDASEYREALALLDRRDRALDRVGAASADPARIDGWLLRASLYLHQGRAHLAGAWAKRAAQATDVPVVRARALTRLGETHGHAGRIDQAELHYHAGLKLFREVQDWKGVGDCLAGLGELALKRGRSDRSRELFEQARAACAAVNAPLSLANCIAGLARAARARGDLDLAWSLSRETLARFEGLGNLTGVAHSRANLAVVAMHRGDHDAAGREVTDALRLFEHAGDPNGQMLCLNIQAEIARFGGDLEAAELGYRHALELSDGLGLEVRVLPAVNLALVVLRRGRYREARAHLESLLEQAEQVGRLGLVGGVHIGLMCCAAATGDISSFQLHFMEGRALLEASGNVDPDVAWPAEQAGELLWDAGHTKWSRAASELALLHWKGLGRADEVTRLKDRLRERFPAPQG